MKFKRSLVAVAATGGMAAVVFGGTAVSTAFTSTTPNNYAEGQGATTGVTVDNGTFDAKNLVPGASPVSVGSVVVHNNGSVPADATITFGSFTVNTNGSNGNAPQANELRFDIAGLGSVTADALAGHSFDLGQIGAGNAPAYAVSEALLAGTGNEWNGADAYLPYTITMTAGS